MNHRKLNGTRGKNSRGFSTLELLMVTVVSLIIAAISIPAFNQVRRALRISGDGRVLNGAINQAKLQAAANFTRARVYADTSALTAANPYATFHIEIWNKALNCWQTVDDFAPGGVARCTIPGTSPVQSLSQGVSFTTGNLGPAPPNTQPGPARQAGLCEVIGGGGGTIGNTACVVFNSRGMAVANGANVGTGAGALNPTGADALYITDNVAIYGVTVGATGVTQVWSKSLMGNSGSGNGNGYGNSSWYRK